MRIRKKFLQLTSYTYPHGTEGFLKSYLPDGHKVDEYGNFFVIVGSSPSTMFTCHLDTASVRQEKVKHVIDGDMISTNGKTILGADDKAGMIVLLYMIENKVPGLYYFFLGEEVGCIGSGKLSNNWKNSIFSNSIKKCVSFDRRGTKSIITHQFFGRCCSDGFAQSLADKLNFTNFGLSMELDNTGIMTDSAKFMTLIPECTNISVGYYNEHTVKEKQNIHFLSNLCKAVCSIDWELLPVIRSVNSNDDSKFLDSDKKKFSGDCYSYFRIGGKSSKKMFISLDKIEDEKFLIQNWIFNKSSFFGVKDIHWNGHMLQIENRLGMIEFVGYRYDLIGFVPELEDMDINDLSEDCVLF